MDLKFLLSKVQIFRLKKILLEDKIVFIENVIEKNLHRGISQIGAGVTTRFIGSMLTNGLDVEKSAKAAFNLQGILMDGAIGGVFGGVQGLKKLQVSSQVQPVKGAGERSSEADKSASKVLDIDELVVRDRRFLNIDGNIDLEKREPNGGRVPGTIKENQTIAAGTIINRYGNHLL